MESFRPLTPPFPALQKDADGIYLPFRENHLLVRATSSSVMLCPSWPKALERPEASHLVGWLDERPCIACELPPVKNTRASAHQGPPGHAFRELRSLHGLLSDAEYAAAITALEILYFDRTYRLCPTCGGPLTRDRERWIKQCPACQLDLEPRVQPTVVGLIHDGVRMLLCQPRGLPQDLYTLPATPLPPGQSLETALTELVRVGLGLHIGECGYFGSQPWPFPDRLIVGLHAPAQGGELRPDPAAYHAARWFHIDDLPALPPPLSLARRMADWYAQLPRIGNRPSLPR